MQNKKKEAKREVKKNTISVNGIEYQITIDANNRPVVKMNERSFFLHLDTLAHKNKHTNKNNIGKLNNKKNKEIPATFNEQYVKCYDETLKKVIIAWGQTNPNPEKVHDEDVLVDAHEIVGLDTGKKGKGEETTIIKLTYGEETGSHMQPFARSRVNGKNVIEGALDKTEEGSKQKNIKNNKKNEKRHYNEEQKQIAKQKSRENLYHTDSNDSKEIMNINDTLPLARQESRENPYHTDSNDSKEIMDISDVLPCSPNRKPPTQAFFQPPKTQHQTSVATSVNSNTDIYSSSFNNTNNSLLNSMNKPALSNNHMPINNRKEGENNEDTKQGDLENKDNFSNMKIR
jgi:hypothetical protein